MKRNIEIKAKLEPGSEKMIMAKAAELSDVTVIIQGKVTYQRIHYIRPDQTGPKLSEYDVVNYETEDDFNTAMESLEFLGEVRKTRNLFIIRHTRVHVDHVEGLGWYFELEVVLSEKESLECGQKEADLFMKTFGIEQNQLMENAYFDILEQKK